MNERTFIVKIHNSAMKNGTVYHRNTMSHSNGKIIHGASGMLEFAKQSNYSQAEMVKKWFDNKHANNDHITVEIISTDLYDELLNEVELLEKM